MRSLSKGYEEAREGFSDEKLERLSQHSLLERGLTPWAAAESESTSFGKCFRKWTCYPSLLPLCFSSDHGVHWESRCWQNETNSPYRIYFTWNKKKSNAMQMVHKKNSYHVPHPWVFYRKKFWGSPPSARSGTLVFWAHSNSACNTQYKNIDGYIDALKKLPEECQPIAICLSYHDIEKNIHKKLRKYGVPLVTAGSAGARDFVDRFYSLIYQFRYATSPNIGSHTFYILEAGIPFFLFGDPPEYRMNGTGAVPEGLLNLRDYGDEDDIKGLAQLRLLLSQRIDAVSDEQRLLISKYLGLDSDMTRSKAAKILWGALVSNPVQLLVLYAGSIFRLAQKLTVKITSK